MPNIQVAVINASTVLTDTDVQSAVSALQTQVSRDFAPAWGVDARLTFVPASQKPPAGSWWLVILDTSDQAGALGYHDLTGEGLPLGKVFAQSDIQYGSSWTVTASHELLEMLGDPDTNLTVFVQPQANQGTLYAYEVCDACEDDQFGYTIGQTLVSDFVFPSWFESFRTPGSAQFDFQSKITRPFQLLVGGYIGVFDVTGGTGWHQITARGAPMSYRMRPSLGSRRDRRRIPRDEWIISVPRRRVGAPGQGATKRTTK